MMAAMSDPASTNDDATDATAGEPTPTERLVRVQHLDTEIDQLTHRRARLPEVEAATEARAAVAAWEAARDALQARIDELGEVITGAEERTAELEAQTARLEAQLKTVIAPREAEALMHEIATLAEDRDGVETHELEALEEQADVEDRLTGHGNQEVQVRSVSSSADAAAATALATLDGEVAALTSSRDEARENVPSGLLARYDRMRQQHLVAVAELNGRQCSGCYLELSAAEVDDVKDEAAAGDGVAACPQCGRMLVV